MADRFDAQAFLKGLDAIFDAHEQAKKAEPYLLQALTDAENAHDEAGQLTVLNEIMGFYRSQSRHEDNQWMVQRALELAAHMGLEDTEAWTTTLINAATSMRAAKRYDQAEDLYRQALDSALKTYGPADRRLAALHNNLSILYSETHRLNKAEAELREALRIIEASSVNADQDLDVASTHTNLALTLLEEGKKEGATAHARKALEIYRNGHLEHSAHYASALAGYAQVCYHNSLFVDAVDAYRHALAVIEECYGTDNDYYRVTVANLEDAVKAAEELGMKVPDENPYEGNAEAPAAVPPAAQPVAGADAQDADAVSEDAASADAAQGTQGVDAAKTLLEDAQSRDADINAALSRPPMTGLQLAKAYWEAYGKPLIAEKYPEYQGRIAAGLVGHGSECYGFDDEISQDHDFGPGFCLWLTAEDYAKIGEQLQADYEALPQTFQGYGPREQTARAQGAGRRVGVFEIGQFFESITGYPQAPAEDAPHEWLMLDEATLAAATNGQVFADPLGRFSKVRQGFKLMPQDVVLSLISRRLGMIAQAGQYNVPRMLRRGDGAAAMLSIDEFVKATASLVFLINTPTAVGYLPYYKWQFAALRKLSRRIATMLADVTEQLEKVLRLSSAACFGGAGFGEGGKGAGPAIDQVTATIDHICAEIVKQLKRERLTESDETFLEWQRPYVEEHIVSSNPVLRSL
ncbi:tetratricopeptide repeat protein [Bifidobacterium sp. DSM 109958]|uniref:Tetratricopeptide repeat protein n=1 Tax=Bifidobacterium moraviense TaxID=2675323 RepID=A0A7Y0HXF6_9BIFI|nr:DUF4037 domain-containing protein [Bifidobacterium sp. DSM 109958]NMN00216.1 tetratricopeptide repeat protein [Bifidobacterium sp. DSM 109958]